MVKTREAIEWSWSCADLPVRVPHPVHACPGAATALKIALATKMYVLFGRSTRHRPRAALSSTRDSEPQSAQCPGQCVASGRDPYPDRQLSSTRAENMLHSAGQRGFKSLTHARTHERSLTHARAHTHINTHARTHARILSRTQTGTWASR